LRRQGPARSLPDQVHSPRSTEGRPGWGIPSGVPRSVNPSGDQKHGHFFQNYPSEIRQPGVREASGRGAGRTSSHRANRASPRLGWGRTPRRRDAKVGKVFVVRLVPVEGLKPKTLKGPATGRLDSFRAWDTGPWTADRRTKERGGAHFVLEKVLASAGGDRGGKDEGGRGEVLSTRHLDTNRILLGLFQKNPAQTRHQRGTESAQGRRQRPLPIPSLLTCFA
jgi:hypothetical protein